MNDADSNGGAHRTDSIAQSPSSSMPGSKHAALSGWGRFPICSSDIFRPEKFAELSAVVGSNSQKLIARGAGRAYGDAALNADNRVVDLQRLNRMLEFDADTGILRAEAGVTIDEIIRVFTRRGYFPAVVPGTRFVTMGGAVAADIHGKSHHRDSSFGTHLLWFDLMLASGEIKQCSREENRELFWATVGGMGLTGVIVEVAIRLRRIESAYIQGEMIRVGNVDEALEKFESIDRQYEASAAWIDCLSAKGALGRSVLQAGNFASVESLPRNLRSEPLHPKQSSAPAVPFNLPNFALNPLSARIFNLAIYATHRDKTHATMPYEPFFFPLDSIHNWNRIYGKRGFTQYQCVWPIAESRAGLIEVLEAISGSGRASFLAVLKKFGAQEGMLSFPMPGYTLALDFPVTDGLLDFLDRLDEMVLKRGGRVYLAKDARMRPDTLRAMYPKFAEWQAVKRKGDPNNHFSSTLSRRLQMDPA
ncbi:MAG TPA: FAD-binding oxidoreductase [Candidatus Binataceae bacterium]|nr:FAD-binding oxidoreductase [Candidatus Binataceae bacterium]